jgi:hypothetical protein
MAMEPNPFMGLRRRLEFGNAGKFCFDLSKLLAEGCNVLSLNYACE